MTAEPHAFEPWHPGWHMPRCKVCREFEDHELHAAGSGATADDRRQAPGSEDTPSMHQTVAAWELLVDFEDRIRIRDALYAYVSAGRSAAELAALLESANAYGVAMALGYTEGLRQALETAERPPLRRRRRWVR